MNREGMNLGVQSDRVSDGLPIVLCLILVPRSRRGQACIIFRFVSASPS